MANAMYLFDELHAVFEKHNEQKAQFNALAAILNRECGIQVYFCEIIGVRWSYVAGDRTLDIPEYRIKINERYGLMAGEILCSESQWQQILKALCEKLSVKI